jgi:hypothetical protein
MPNNRCCHYVGQFFKLGARRKLRAQADLARCKFSRRLENPLKNWPLAAWSSVIVCGAMGRKMKSRQCLKCKKIDFTK